MGAPDSRLGALAAARAETVDDGCVVLRFDIGGSAREVEADP